MKTILFDIDGTILNCNKAGKVSLIKSTMDVFGTIGHMERLNFQGKTDPLILYESLKHMGFDEKTIDNNTDKLKEKYFEYLRETIFEYEVTIFPGILEIIKKLSKDDNIILGLLTGNFQKSAGIKISRFDLNKYFIVGAYGDDASNRNDLPPIARTRIMEQFNIDLNYSEMIIIGDTIYDVKCAKHSGAVSIAVGTGWGDQEELLAEEPDFFFEDLGDVDMIIETIDSI